MAAIMKTIHQLENKFDGKAERFAFRHPCAAVLGMFIGVPLLILLIVTCLTMLFAVPMTMILG